MPTYYSRSNYTGDGAITQRAVSFPFLLRAHVKVYLDDVETTAFTWLHDGLINITTAPANGVNVSRSTRTSAFEYGIMLERMPSTALISTSVL